jgi:hypothetical protein
MLGRKSIIKQLFVVSFFSFACKYIIGFCSVLWIGITIVNSLGGRVRKKAHNCRRIHFQAGFEGMLTNALLSKHNKCFVI